MKTFKFFSLFFFILSSLFLSAQVDKVKYLLSYNNDSCYYDAFIVIEEGSATEVYHRFQLGGVFNIVVPFGTEISIVRSYMPLLNNANYNGTVPLDWNFIGGYYDYPAVNPQERFCSIYPSQSPFAQYNNLFQSDTVKIFSIKIDTFIFDDSMRIWDNESDPKETQLSNGVAFKNGISIGSGNNIYYGNFPVTPATKPSIVDLSNPSSIQLDINHANQCGSPYNYNWSGPNGFTSTTKEILISNAQPLNNGPYCCFITNSIGKIDTLCIDICKLGCSTIIDTTFCSPGVLILDSGIQGSTWQESASNPAGAVVSNLGDGLVEITFGGAASGLYTLYYNDGGFVGFMKINVPQTSQLVYTGPRRICQGSTTTVSPSTGGVWTSSNPIVALVSNTGIVTTLSQGTATLTYASSNGCSRNLLPALIVDPVPIVLITGPSEICIGETTTLSPTTGGTWTSTNPAVANVTNSGAVTGVSNGTVQFVFTASGSQCTSSTETITVGNIDMDLVSYTICAGDTIDLIPAVGDWSSSDPNIVQLLPGYKAVGISSGDALITVSLNNSCFTSSNWENLKVNPIPTTTLSTLEVCLGGIVSIAPFGGGTWQSSNNTIATINNQGHITTLAPGKVTFKYTKLATGCMSDQKDTLTIVAGPSVAITGPSQLCIGEITTLSPNSGGTWISSNTAVATVTNNGIVTAVSKGDANFVFTEVATFCVSNRTTNISVGDYSLIKYDTLGLGNLIALDTLIPGAWTSSDTSVVKILDNHTAIGMKQGDALLYFKDGTNIACGDKKIFVHVVAKSTKVIGYTFRDVNNNEIYDLNIDTPLPNFPVTNLTLGNTIYSDQNGFFEIRIEQDEQLIIDAPYGKWDSIQVNRLVKFESSNNDIVFVGFYPTPLVIEGMVNLSSASLRCNSNVKFNASIFNVGNELLSGKLVVDISNKTSFVSAIPQPTSKVGSVLTWDFQNLKPGFNFAPDIRIYVPNPALVGSKLSFDGYLIGANNDTLNHKFFEDDILCSYDPNDKRSWPDRDGDENLTLRAEHIDYMVRFQNTGNAEAFRVELVDVLPKGLDKMSMMILENSHAMETQMIGDTLKFIFDDINLPDSMSNPEGSQGYVLFSFKSEEGIAENTVLSNTASIFFDENAPIVTNTVINTIVTSILCHEDTTNIAICPGESFSTDNNDYNAEGIFSERTYGADGCDTLNHYRISFSEVPSDSIWFDSGIMYVNDSGTSYDWYECEKDSLLFTTILPNAEIVTSGIYGAIIHGVECDVETECVVVVINGLNDLLLNEIQVYPNPASDKLMIQSPYEIESVVIWNVYGQKMDVIINESTLDLNSFPNGAYFARIFTKSGNKIVKFTVVK